MEKNLKDILLKDLCARLPYGVKCQVQEDEFIYIGTLCRLEIDSKNGNLLDFTESMSGLDCQVYLSEVKPYLFPLSSMTEEQKQYLKNRFCYDWDGKPYDLWKCQIEIGDADELIDFFHKNHLDYRGLIPMDLAIDATGLNIY